MRLEVATFGLVPILELVGGISNDVWGTVGEVTLSWRPSLGDLGVPSFLLVLSSRSKHEVFRGAKYHEQLRCESSIATGVVPWSA